MPEISRLNDDQGRLTTSAGSRYTCKEYREEMTLLNLRRRLCRADLPEAEKNQLRTEIAHLQRQMGMD